MPIVNVPVFNGWPMPTLNAARPRVLLPLLCMATLTFAACGDSKVESEAPVVRKPTAAVPVDPTAKMARAVTVGKSNVQIELKYDIAAKPMAGRPVQIELALVPAQGADSMSVTLAPSPGLTLSADALPDVEPVKAATPYSGQLTAKADKAEVFFITITTTLYTAGTSSVRTFAIPLILSDPNAPAAAPAAAKKT